MQKKLHKLDDDTINHFISFLPLKDIAQVAKTGKRLAHIVYCSDIWLERLTKKFGTQFHKDLLDNLSKENLHQSNDELIIDALGKLTPDFARRFYIYYQASNALIKEIATERSTWGSINYPREQRKTRFFIDNLDNDPRLIKSMELKKVSNFKCRIQIEAINPMSEFIKVMTRDTDTELTQAFTKNI